jgi:hypothetical protein
MVDFHFLSGHDVQADLSNPSFPRRGAEILRRTGDRNLCSDNFVSRNGLAVSFDVRQSALWAATVVHGSGFS